MKVGRVSVYLLDALVKVVMERRRVSRSSQCILFPRLLPWTCIAMEVGLSSLSGCVVIAVIIGVGGQSRHYYISIHALI